MLAEHKVGQELQESNCTGNLGTWKKHEGASVSSKNYYNLRQELAF